MADPQGMYGIPAGTDKFFAFRASKALYDSLVDNLGLTKLETAAEQAKAVRVPAASFCLRLGVVYKGTTRNQTGAVWCNPSKYEEAMAGMDAATWRGKDILRTFQPLDSTRR